MAVLINVTLKGRSACAGGKQYEFPPWTHSRGVEVNDALAVRHLVAKHGAFDNWQESIVAEPKRFLRPMQPGLIKELEAQYKMVAPWSQAAGVTTEDRPSVNWSKAAILSYCSKKGIAAAADWAKERLLRVALEGPAAEDRAELERRQAARETERAAAEQAARTPDGPMRRPKVPARDDE